LGKNKGNMNQPDLRQAKVRRNTRTWRNPKGQGVHTQDHLNLQSRNTNNARLPWQSRERAPKMKRERENEERLQKSLFALPHFQHATKAPDQRQGREKNKKPAGIKSK